MGEPSVIWNVILALGSLWRFVKVIGMVEGGERKLLYKASRYR